ncbi:MAG TPA: serine/threonine-protein kinase, partial [Ktedonobacteraceae bacterium]|nr:serine/threonine-protein kinase [Ktedonobacteraceae bacterium]
MRTSLLWEASPISRQNGKSNTQTGQLDPRTLLRKRYVIVRAIGRGGMAAVYEARDTRRGTSCAIKEMSLSTVPQNERSQAIQNFLAEARILSRLNHPNLPAFTDFFTEGQRHFLVMEFIDGSTLEELLEANHGSFSERRVLGWARQLCDVLEYLHGQQPPIIFRDLKPGNIMLTRSGRIKLIDFGIARLFRFSGSQDTQLLGTPGFAPPEQYGSSQTDERSDIYSLSMTLFQLMTDSMNEQGFGLKDVHFTFPLISPPVARVLEKATTLKPEDRYESVVVFRRALLGIGTFRFENGGEATTPDELVDLCSHYPEEAADYLFAGEIESWLQEIGEGELARAAKRIRATIGDPEMAVNRFLQAVVGSGVPVRGTSVHSSAKGQTGSYRSVGEGASQTSRAVREPVLVVDPKTIDFGQVYPGLSAPILLTVSGAKGAMVSGSLHPVESWIVLDQTTFDGTRVPINVRVDSTRLRGSTHYTGTIMVSPDESEREIAVTIEVDVLGYTTTTIARKAAPPAQNALPDDTVVSGTGRMRMAPKATVTVDQPLDTSRAT